MNTSPHAEEQAALWAARIDGSTLGAADRAALDAWLAANPAHRLLLSSYCQFSADLEQRLPLLAGIRDGLAESPTANNTTRPFPWLPRPIWAGAMLAAVAVVAVMLWPDRTRQQLQTLTAPVGARQSAVLADGSQLELNAGTAATVEITGAARHVRLAGGEAFFRVNKDPDRPFLIETPAGSVRVTGTQFNVRTEADGLEVVVLEGSVQVRPGGTDATRTLLPGDRFAVQGGRIELERLPEPRLADALAWRTGQVVFHGTPLREALQRFARYHGRDLAASDTAATRLVGGRYSLDDLDGFLAAVGTFPDLQVTRGPDGAIRVETKPSS